MLYVSFFTGNILNIVIGILIEILMFNIIYSAMDADVDYLKKVLVYTIGMEIEQMILTRYMSPAIFILPVTSFPLSSYILAVNGLSTVAFKV